jgi:hypothetical protein
MRASPLNPDDVGSASSAGNSSTRRYLSGSSSRISNSIGTRLLPRTRRVRPEATSVLTPASLSPPSAFRASVSTCSALAVESGLGGAAGAWAWAKATAVVRIVATRQEQKVRTGASVFVMQQLADRRIRHVIGWFVS